MNVGDARLALIEGQHNIFVYNLPGVGRICERILGNSVQVTCRHQIIELLRGLVLVLRVLVDGAAHGIEVFLEDGLFCAPKMLGVDRNGDSYQDSDDRDHDDHLNQREAAS